MPVPQAQARDVDAPAPRSARRVRGESRALDLTGRVLGCRYRLVRQLGHGGMATIYEAEHVEIGKRVAIKVLAGARCEDTARRFLQEARAASQLRHEHIIDVTDFGRDAVGGEPLAYMVMEQLEGEDLAATLEQDGPLRWTRVLAIAKQICRALIAAHDQNIVHCDIKPANCFRITRGDTADFIKVLDFGVASFACKHTGRCTPDPLPASSDEPGRRKSGPRLGTPGYMAAELLSGGSYDHRVDIYALGVLMYRLLTNKMPYPAPRLYTLGDSSSGGPTASPSASGNSEGSGNLAIRAPFPMRRAIATLEISAEFEAVVLKALAQDPEQRHASARCLLAALEAAEVAALPASPLPRDPLSWGGGAHPLHGEERRAAEDSASMSQTEVSRAAFAAHSNAELQRTAPEFATGASSSWLRRAQAAAYRDGKAGRSPAGPGFAGLMTRAALALVVTTIVVRVAWTLLV